MTDAREEDAAAARSSPSGWDYAPAPESRDIVRLDERYGLFVGGEWLEPRETYTTISPGDRGAARRGRPGDARGGAARRSRAARDAFENGWSALPGSERAKYLFRIARILQERSREFAVLESLNGGKPIKESRDVDLPLAAAHFFYYAGWADKLEYAFPNRRPRPLGVAGQIIPWNFPLLMLAWKIAPALACREHRRAQAGRDDAADGAALLRRRSARPSCRRASSTSSPATAAPAPRSSSRDVDKIAFTGSTEVGKAIQRELAGTGKKLTLELGGKAANIVFDDCALDQAVEGIVNGIYFNQGHVCCAGSRLLRPGVDLRGRRREAEAADGDAARRRPARQEHRRRRDQLAAAAREDPGARRGGRGGGRRDLPAAVPAAREGLLVRADRLHGRRAELPDRPGGDLRAGALGADVPHAGRGGREGEQHAVRAVGRRLDGEGLADPLDGRAAARRRRLGEHVQPLRPGLAVRRLQGVRLRPRGRPPRPRAVPGVRDDALSSRPCRHGTVSTTIAVGRRPGTLAGATARCPAGRGDEPPPVKKTYKLYIGGAFPRSESGRTYEAEGQNVARASRKDLRDAVRAARAAQPGWAGATAYNRGQVALPHRRDDGGAPRRPRRALLRARTRSTRAIDRLVWYAGWADKLAQVLGGTNPVAGPYFNFTDPRADRRRRDPRARRAARSRGSSRGSRRRSSAATRSSSSPPSSTRSPRSSSPRCSPPPTSPAASSTSSPAQRAELAPWLAGAHGRERDRRHRRRRRSRAELERLAAENVKRVVRGTPTARARGRSPPSSS